MVNSWGPDWGDKGFLWLSEDFVHDHAFEGWADIPGGPVSRSFERSGGKIVGKNTPHISIEPPIKKVTAR
jgi:hypothetical protein